MNSRPNPLGLPVADRPPRGAAVALTIAGSDPSGGAGIQADLKTFAAHGVYGAAAVAALTVQSTRGVVRTEQIDGALVYEQAAAVLIDLPVRSMKTGMLGTAAAVRAVLDVVERFGIRPVVDPVLLSSSGAMLLDDEGAALMRDALVTRAAIVTPNLPEAAFLVGARVRTLEEQREAALTLVARGAGAALVTGGHGEGDDVVDVLVAGGEVVELRAPRIATSSTHGTGCTLSAAICARLARGEGLKDAVSGAIAYVRAALAAAPGLGHGKGPLGHDAAPPDGRTW